MKKIQTFEVIILGGGISGIAAAVQAQNEGLDWCLLEQSPQLGGLTRSIYVNDYIFDYTGHFLHLSKFSKPSEISEGFNDDEWIEIAKNAKCFFSNMLIDAPFQYNLNQLPEKIYREFIQDYLNYYYKPNKTEISFKDYLINNFGKKIANAFLIPYNEKLLATNLDRISQNAITRFFPPPKKELILSTENRNKATMYNSKFWYPKNDGIQHLVKSLSKNLDNKRIRKNTRVCKINLKKQIIITDKGEQLKYKSLINSLPLNVFILSSELNKKYYKYLENDITAATVFSIHIGVNSKIPDIFKDVHWIYFSEKEFPFYRVGFYSNFNAVMAPKGKYSIYVEIGVKNRLKRQNVIVRNIIDKLEKVGILKEKNIELLITNYMKDGYVHYTHKREKLIKEISNLLNNKNVKLIGRYGKWQYSSMEDSIIEGYETIKSLNL